MSAPPARKRKLRPRATAALVVAPATVTDLTSHAVLGLEDHQFRAFVVAKRIPHTRFGHRVIARLDLVLAAVASETIESSEPATEEPETVGSVLARIGRRRCA